MNEITKTRRRLEAAVEPVLEEGEQVTVTAAPSEYAAGLNRLRFSVVVTVGKANPERAERLDELLDPNSGVKAALEAAPAQVIKSGGHQLHAEGLGSTWTAECVT